MSCSWVLSPDTIALLDPRRMLTHGQAEGNMSTFNYGVSDTPELLRQHRPSCEPMSSRGTHAISPKVCSNSRQWA